jgi:hypothetical protein
LPEKTLHAREPAVDVQRTSANVPSVREQERHRRLVQQFVGCAAEQKLA